MGPDVQQYSDGVGVPSQPCTLLPSKMLRIMHWSEITYIFGGLPVEYSSIDLFDFLLFGFIELNLAHRYLRNVVFNSNVFSISNRKCNRVPQWLQCFSAVRTLWWEEQMRNAGFSRKVSCLKKCISGLKIRKSLL